MGVWIETVKDAAPPNAKSVTPCMGVWIETCYFRYYFVDYHVTPCMGVWIETFLSRNHLLVCMSHPVWVCGLKLLSWISRYQKVSHTLYGCVD